MREASFLGVWPDVSLKEARGKHLAARQLLAQGIDPSAARRIANAVSAVAGHDIKAAAEKRGGTKVADRGRVEASPRAEGSTNPSRPTGRTTKIKHFEHSQV
ncbi:MAG TPA: Arm DNA-binding domain-containing protein [Caldimonas sp.]|nr:Arm DNA-binding domain-containing protein [Caldimonas sp.]